VGETREATTPASPKRRDGPITGMMTHGAHDVKLTTDKGDAALDPRVEGIAVYATSATTKRLQAAKRATPPATTP